MSVLRKVVKSGTSELVDHDRDASSAPRFGTAAALIGIHLGACAAFLPGMTNLHAVLVGSVLYYVTGAIGICLGYHRLLTH